MTVTGDWTMVKGATATTDDPSTHSETASSSPSLQSQPLPRAVRFPCLEQPPRFALRSGPHYLGSTKHGKLVGRKKRSENDEWTISFVETDSFDGTPNGPGGTAAEDSVVTIQNHKFGRILSLVPTDATDSGTTVACVAKEDGTNNNTTNNNDLDLEPESPTANPEQLPDDEDDNSEGDNHSNGSGNSLVLPDTADKEDLQWCVARWTGDGFSNGGVTIVSLKTGDSLGMNPRGQVVLKPRHESRHVWEMECVTGELLFLSNPVLDARVRCDMTGLLTLSPNWKGWEVVRITEAAAPYSRHGGIGDGYVRISSWMHSQWFLCSDAKGNVSACTVAESLLPAPTANAAANTATPNATANDEDEYRCSKWAIEKYPTDEGNKHEGVVIRSATHGRLLSIKDGLLKTYDSLDALRDDQATTPTKPTTTTTTPETTAIVEASKPASQETDNLGDAIKHHTEEVKRKTDELKRMGSQWWRQSVTNVQKAVSESAMQRRNSKLPPESPTAAAAAAGSILEEETIVWQLEAGHLQTYYFISTSPSSSAESESEVEEPTAQQPPQQPRSIGAFPTVTENLRKSDKIRFERDDATPGSLKLYLPDEDFYVCCSSKGSISATKQKEDEGTDWILEDHPSGSTFRSKSHGRYLSFRTEESSTPAVPPQASSPNDDDDETIPSTPLKGKLKNPFENIKLPLNQKPKTPVQELCATETPTTVWRLEPCTPRAISSKRLKTFAIGTSIAVGTTIAMPFALAGVAAAMGALGAEAGIGFGIVAAGLSGAEALASVGAIGATAYFCFKPEQNSLSSDLPQGGDSTANPWTKRPFSNWRNW